MSDHRDILERGLREFRAPELPYEAILQRLDRHRRNQRIAAAVVGAVAATLLIVGVLAGVRALDLSKGTTPAAPSPSINGRIAFVRHPSEDLFTAAADGSDVRRIVDVPVSTPHWSTDGSTIAFSLGSYYGLQDQRIPDVHIYTVGGDGRGLTQITKTGQGSEFSPNWSPSGTQLVVDAERPEAPAGLAIIDVATGGLTPITTNPYGFWDGEPGWSPDGTQIVFVRIRRLEPTQQGAIFVVNPDGTDLRRLTGWDLDAGTPSWSPDGSTIVFSDGGSTIPDPIPEAQIFSMDADGTNMRKLTDDSNAASFWPSWSPDGELIVFTRFVYAPTTEPFDLYSMKPDGTNEQPLFRTPDLEENEADWGVHR